MGGGVLEGLVTYTPHSTGRKPQKKTHMSKRRHAIEGIEFEPLGCAEVATMTLVDLCGWPTALVPCVLVYADILERCSLHYFPNIRFIQFVDAKTRQDTHRMTFVVRRVCDSLECQTCRIYSLDVYQVNDTDPDHPQHLVRFNLAEITAKRIVFFYQHSPDVQPNLKPCLIIPRILPRPTAESESESESEFVLHYCEADGWKVRRVLAHDSLVKSFVMVALAMQCTRWAHILAADNVIS